MPRRIHLEPHLTDDELQKRYRAAVDPVERSHGARLGRQQYPNESRAGYHQRQHRAGECGMGPGSRQDFRFKSLGWTQTAGVYEIAVGQDIVALEAQLAAAMQHVAQLEQQLQNQPVPVSVETPPVPQDPKAVEALVAVMELAKALKLIQETQQTSAA